MSQTRISLLVELLKSFTEKEVTLFAEFIESSYFNKDQTLIVLLKKLKRYALGTEKFIPDLQLKVYEEAYCDKPLNQTELTKKQYMFLNNKQSRLLRLAEQFLMIENFKAKENTRPEYLYPELIDKNQTNLYQRHLKSDIKMLKNESTRNVDFYLIQYKLQKAILYTQIKNGEIDKLDNYDDLQHYLNINYILEKLQFHLAQITLKNIYKNKTYKFSTVSEISNLLKMPIYANNPLIKIYLANIELANNQNDKSFNYLLNIINENNHILVPGFLRIFYVNLANYCSSQLKKGKVEYYQKLFDIYKGMHESNLFVKENFIDSNFFKNVITVSCAVEQFDWANNVLLYYKKFIQPKIRESIFCYNKGVIEFNQNNYLLAQEWFLKVDKINDTFEIGLRIFMLQCIFEVEQDYNEATKQSFESAKQFFKRNVKLSSINKNSYLNFINTFIDLYKFKHKITKFNLKKIKNKLNQLKVVHKKKWLSEKISEMGGNYLKL